MKLHNSQSETDSITPDAFAHAYMKGFRVTVRFLRSKGASIDAAEELAQTAWARGWEARAQLQIENRILPWINSIAYHRFCNDQRRLGRHSQLIEVSDSRRPTSVDSLDAGILLNLCSPIEKKLLTQRYIEGLEMKEIAATQGLTEIAVRVRIHRCQCSLRARVMGGSSNTRSRHLQSRTRTIQSASENAGARAA